MVESTLWVELDRPSPTRDGLVPFFLLESSEAEVRMGHEILRIELDRPLVTSHGIVKLVHLFLSIAETVPGAGAAGTYGQCSTVAARRLLEVRRVLFFHCLCHVIMDPEVC